MKKRNLAAALSFAVALAPAAAFADGSAANTDALRKKIDVPSRYLNSSEEMKVNLNASEEYKFKVKENGTAVDGDDKDKSNVRPPDLINVRDFTRILLKLKADGRFSGTAGDAVLYSSDNDNATVAYTAAGKLKLKLHMKDKIKGKGTWTLTFNGVDYKVQGDGDLEYVFDKTVAGKNTFSAKFLSDDLAQGVVIGNLTVDLQNAPALIAPISVQNIPSGYTLENSDNVKVLLLPNHKLWLHLKTINASGAAGNWFIKLGGKLYLIAGKDEIAYELDGVADGKTVLNASFIPLTAGVQGFDIKPVDLNIDSSLVVATTAVITSPTVLVSPAPAAALPTPSAAPLPGSGSTSGVTIGGTVLVTVDANGAPVTPAPSASPAPSTAPSTEPSNGGQTAADNTAPAPSANTAVVMAIPNSDGTLTIHAKLNNDSPTNGTWTFNVGGTPYTVDGGSDITYTVPNAPIGTYVLASSFAPENGPQAIQLAPATVSMPTMTGGELPNTSTPWYNYLLLGAALSILGLSTLRRGKKQHG